jgi:hypothetical protein
MDEFLIIEQLKKRFFWWRTQGNQHYFMDIETGNSELSPSHIMGFLISEDGGSHNPNIVKKVCTHLKDELFPICKEPVYAPLEPQVVTRGGFYYRNSWTRPEVEPTDVKCQPFLDHLLAAMGSQDKVDYLLDLLSFRFQKPKDNKPHAVVYLYQAEGGNGKSLLATTLQRVFGESAVQIASEAKMNSGSKVQLWGKTILIAEEASVKRGSDIYETIKTYSGTDEIFDDVKHAHFKKYKIPATLVMLSNNAPNFLEPLDRRFFVSEWKIDLDKDAKAKYFNAYVHWLEKEGGYGAISGMLSRRVVDRDMYAPVPLTEEKMQAMSVGQDGCVREILDAMDDQPMAHVFKISDFGDIFERHDVKTSQKKYKLAEAGLVEHSQRVIVEKDRFRPWLRKKDKIFSIKGDGSFLNVDGVVKALDREVLLKEPYSL